MASRRSSHDPRRAATAALTILANAGIEHTVHTFESGTDNFGEVAAAHLTHLHPGQIMKTLVVSSGKELAICVIPVDHHLSLKKAAAAWGVKSCEMADPHRAQLATGYIPGGITAIGTKRRLPVFLEATACEWEVIAVSGGKRGVDVELTPADYLAVASATPADLIDATR
ncbi:MAG: aminoacyl-tRNA deacylase [Corynebacterium sp.]|nr:aminoacyl-tRNA deacylase [Corynebacterium sp.]